MTEYAYEKLVRRIVATGIPRAQAEEYAGLIGDTPETVLNEVIIRDDSTGAEIARLPASVLRDY